MSTAAKSMPPQAELSYVYRERALEAGSRHAFPELAVVRLRFAAQTFDGQHVPAGQLGTIVMVHGDGEAYDVEFSVPAGIAAVGPEDLTDI